jgi:hypothetical protein
MRLFLLVRGLASMLLLLIASGCGETKAPEQPKSDSAARARQRKDSLHIVSGNLPAGRFQLPTKHTPAPDLFISLPDGYTIKDASRFPDERFFIVRMDDPSIKDTTQVTPGFLRIYLGVNPQSGIEPGRKPTERAILLGGHPLVWKLWEDHLPDGRIYYGREIATSDFFAALSPELAKAPLNLHLYVAGSDTTRVNELMRAVETLALHP